MLGLPPGLSYEEYVGVALNADRIRWLRVDDLVAAVRIANGSQPPVGYYEAVTGDAEAGRATYADQLLSRMMR